MLTTAVLTRIFPLPSSRTHPLQLCVSLPIRDIVIHISPQLPPYHPSPTIIHLIPL